MNNRTVPGRTFHGVGEALLNRNRLQLDYRSYKGQNTRRTVSPQTLVYYRENWYRDAWCHLRGGLRTFSLARIERVAKLPDVARAVPKHELESYFAQGYGIFAGTATHLVQLRFFSDIAREAAM